MLTVWILSGLMFTALVSLNIAFVKKAYHHKNRSITAGWITLGLTLLSVLTRSWGEATNFTDHLTQSPHDTYTNTGLLLLLLFALLAVLAASTLYAGAMDLIWRPEGTDPKIQIMIHAGGISLMLFGVGLVANTFDYTNAGQDSPMDELSLICLVAGLLVFAVFLLKVRTTWPSHLKFVRQKEAELKAYLAKSAVTD